MRMFYVLDRENGNRMAKDGSVVPSRLGINLDAIACVRFYADRGEEVAEISFGANDRVVVDLSEWEDIVAVLTPSGAHTMRV